MIRSTAGACAPVLLLLGLTATPGGAQTAGVVEGRVTSVAPELRWALRYPGSGAAAATLHPVPVVVWLEGELPAPAAAPQPVSILQEGGRFVPGAAAVRTGTVVRFPNGDPYYHNVFSYTGARFDLGRYPPGESREVVLGSPGIVRTFCEIHEFMRAVILVTDHGFHAVAGADGTFRIAGVPPGSYTVKAYHPDLGTVEAPVTVTAGAPALVSLEMGG